MKSSCLHYHFETIGSTNTWAKENVHQIDPEGVTLISASEQTLGRGRFKRHWQSPIKLNIYATFCFYIDSNRSDFGHLPQLLALAVIQVLEDLNFHPTLKWPNDILLNGKKVAGILCETMMLEQKRCIINGIGLNVNMPTELLNKIDRPATSLFKERGHEFDLNILLKQLDFKFTSYLSHFLKNGFDAFFPSFQLHSTFKQGQFIQFNHNQTLLEGTFEGLHPDGSVQIKLLDGTSKKFYSGEFMFEDFI
ncbi:Bifunctional ligase/repressor BirA [Candidatus Protochlamydia amoebophila]|uniref:biotin--[acetyl-CoA-carboxylase] ligase n=1 Tax=Candidatus Protochlamydia amoebophila TaxID=362787 RepID=UPI001BC90310|nr:biotin--[acetyl-CoA-carboxylase] ligase [Candidatus Protochlamydia amoebophila]MBS4163290.1 Bifunctional ligase/repressor BirA [Candidatus Protochlamydia amoebophila]